MTQHIWLRLAELLLFVLLTTAILFAWRQERADRTQLQAELAAANQQLADDTARQQDRDAKLNDTLAAIAAQKKATLTPDQLLAAIAREASLPNPLALATGIPSPPKPTSSGTTQSPVSNPAGNSPASPLQAALAGSSTGPATGPSTRPGIGPVAGSGVGPGASENTLRLPIAPDAKIPSSDLRPLYNYLLDCKACQSKLDAAQSDLADEKAKTVTLTKSRDAAIQAAQGGSIWRRTARALKWFALGAAAGAIAAKALR